MTVKSLALVFTLLLLYFASGCKKESTPEPQPARISYIEPLGELLYEGNLISSIGRNKLLYDVQQRVSNMVWAGVDTTYSTFSGVTTTHLSAYYLRYGVIWEGVTVRGIKIDSSFSQQTSNGIPMETSYDANVPLISFFYTENRLDSLLSHIPSQLSGTSKITFEYDDKHRISKKTSTGSIQRPPLGLPSKFVQIDSAFEYDDYHNPYHLLYRQLGTLLPELLTENFSPNNPTKYTTYYKEGTMELTYDVNCSYTYNAQRYPTQIATTAGSGLPSIKALRYE